MSPIDMFAFQLGVSFPRTRGDEPLVGVMS